MREQMIEYLEEKTKEEPQRRVYICSQYGSRGTRSTNLELAKAFTSAVVDEGSTPVCPHLFLHEVLNDDDCSQRAAGMEIGIQMMRMCDEVRVFTRISEGMAVEIMLAEAMHIPVNIADLRCVYEPAGARKMERQIAADLEVLRYGKKHHTKAH